MGVRLWVDDLRPAPPGWVHVKTVEEAKTILLEGGIDDLALDNDLGHAHAPCAECDIHHFDCECACHALAPEGYTLLHWLIELLHEDTPRDYWPKNKPTVLSANPVRGPYMRELISKYFPRS